MRTRTIRSRSAIADLLRWVDGMPVWRSIRQSMWDHLASGIGQMARLANQMILRMTIAAVAEARPLAARGEADPAHVRAALNGPRMVERDFVMRGRKVMLLKDLDNTQDAVCRIRFSASVLAETASLFRELTDAEGEPDHSALICQIER